MSVRLRAEQLPQHLRQQLAPLYLVHGDEALLVQEAADAIRAAARAAGYTEREVVLLDAHAPWQELDGLASGRSLFGDRRIVELRLATLKPGTQGAAALEKWVSQLPADTLTLITLPRPDKATQATKWFRAIEAQAAAVTIASIDRQRLPAWIDHRLHAAGLSITPPALQLLADRVEGNLLAAHQEILKLSLLYPQGKIDTEQVRAAVLSVARFDVFELVDALLLNDLPRYLRILDNLREEGQEPPRILWALAREIRQLATLGRRCRQGISVDRALRDAHVWESRQPLFKRALQRLQPAMLETALLAASECDRMVKGLVSGDPWLALARLGQGLMLPPRARQPGHHSDRKVLKT